LFSCGGIRKAKRVGEKRNNLIEMKLILGFVGLGISEILILVAIIVMVIFIINKGSKNKKNEISKSLQIKKVKKEEKSEDQEVKTTFVPKKKPVRKSNS
jgi:hypothetical protein